MRQEAALTCALLQSAGLHPIVAYYDESGVPHPVDPGEPFLRAAGLMVPVTTAFAVFVPEDEGQVAETILEDAQRSPPGAEGQD